MYTYGQGNGCNILGMDIFICDFPLRHINNNSPLTVSPCATELSVSILHSFEAGIPDAMSSFKWMKNNIIY